MANETIEKPLQAEEGVWVTGPDGELIPDYESTFPTINEGEVVHGTVVRVDKDEVLVDIGYKSEGVIPVAELSIRRSVNPADEVSVGEEIDALVLTKEDAEGRLILSKKRARFELAWKKIEAAAESGEPVIGRVIEVVKGGLILDLGVRGFLPASLVDIRRVQDLDEFMATELRCKVIELNRSRNNVVLSRRAVLEDERKDQRQQILDRLNPGDVVEGTISNIVDFGAFVDLNGMDGLIHISELSWSHVNHPSEVLEIGQEVKVKVLDIDRDRQRISLGLKQTQSDPWQQVLESYSENDVVEGRVTKVVTFGAFVEILPGVEGLVHISELAQHHVENPREVVSQGDAVNVLILEVDAERRRLSLSLKRVDEGVEPLPRADGGESVHLTPNLNLSEDVFPAATDIDGSDATDEAEPTPTDTEGEEEVAPAAVAEVAVDDVVEEEIAVAPEAEAVEAAEEAPEAVAEPELEDTPAPETDAAAETGESAEVPEAAAEPELEDTPAPETDAEVEVELEAEPTADAEAAAGAEPMAESSVDADADADAASGDEPESESDQTA
jgi:small subunit ribosomal protein S1